MNETIVRFIQKQTCASICCVDENNRPYCFSCFYAFNAEDGLLYFKSSVDAHHSLLMKKNEIIAGTILPDKLNMLLVKGIQFEGVVLAQEIPVTEKAPSVYHKTYPLAAAMEGEVWTIQINSIKMTGNTLGFGKKIIWNREVAGVRMP